MALFHALNLSFPLSHSVRVVVPTVPSSTSTVGFSNSKLFPSPCYHHTVGGFSHGGLKRDDISDRRRATQLPLTPSELYSGFNIVSEQILGAGAVVSRGFQIDIFFLGCK